MSANKSFKQVGAASLLSLSERIFLSPGNMLLSASVDRFVGLFLSERIFLSPGNMLLSAFVHRFFGLYVREGSFCRLATSYILCLFIDLSEVRH